MAINHVVARKLKHIRKVWQTWLHVHADCLPDAIMIPKFGKTPSPCNLLEGDSLAAQMFATVNEMLPFLSRSGEADFERALKLAAQTSLKSMLKLCGFSCRGDQMAIGLRWSCHGHSP